MKYDRSAKIIATIGPASNSSDQIRSLIRAGMDVARLNFSHGDLDEHAKVLRDIRQASKELGRSVGVMQDLRGPKLRIAPFAEGSSIELRKGDRIKLRSDLH
jgi:pyruvate kinase